MFREMLLISYRLYTIIHRDIKLSLRTLRSIGNVLLLRHVLVFDRKRAVDISKGYVLVLFEGARDGCDGIVRALLLVKRLLSRGPQLYLQRVSIPK